MDYLLAVDVGGTKCDALLADAFGHPLAWARSQARPEDPIFKEGFGRSPIAVQRAVASALKGYRGGRLVYACLGDQPHVPEGLSPTICPLVEIDAPMALAGVDDGIVALAGTGALVQGVSEDGRTLHLDGLGPYYGDFGSAFHIGLMGLRASGRSSWHPRFSTSLGESIPKACAEMAGDPNLNMVAYMLEVRNRGEIASLARLVSEAAEAGDAVAADIIRQAAQEMSETVYAVAAQLGMIHEPTNLVGTGSVMRRSKLYWKTFVGCVRTFMPHVRPILPMEDAVFGMALAAARGRVEDLSEFRSNLLGGRMEPVPA